MSKSVQAHGDGGDVSTINSNNNNKFIAFDFSKLNEEFIKICADFADSQPPSQASQSLDFALKVLFEISPKLKEKSQHQTRENIMWRLLFRNANGSETSAYVYTYKFQSPMNVQPRVRDGKIYLTPKQAALLAVTKMCSALPPIHEPRKKILLTPLSYVVFAPSKISTIANELTLVLGRDIDISDVIKVIISSCQIDGFHLKYSECHVALVAIDVTIGDDKNGQRRKLREKTMRQYMKRDKFYDPVQYRVYAKHSRMINKDITALMVSMPILDFNSLPSPRVQTLSLSTALRNIVKSTDDPLSGGTHEMQARKLELKNFSNSKLPENLPHSQQFEMQVDKTTMESFQTKREAKTSTVGSTLSSTTFFGTQ